MICSQGKFVLVKNCELLLHILIVIGVK